ncbi:hypothetical protein FACS1894180_0400 [Bacteroidia bacterium]|nr:hypothetical protein FACS1894178_4210 [Bacteroidia bacterium]GHV42881.1 hypothetical protein FACS1894180_0400 [Bacteroidia bacterium]
MNLIKDKSFKFAVEIVNLCKILQNNKEFVLCKQLLQSGTSIGANYREAEKAESKLDFIHKLSIVLKECNETEFWLDLLFETDYIEKNIYNNLIAQLKDITNMTTASINTTKKNLEKSTKK